MAKLVKLHAGVEFTAISIPAGNPVNVTIIKEIGSGGSAVVFEGRTNAGRRVVVKAPRDKNADEFGFKAERQILQNIQSPNLPRLFGSCESHGQIILVFEKLYPNPLLYMNRRSLRKNVKVIYDTEAHYIPLPGPTALNIGRELLVAINALHSKNFVHCDVKLANFMIRLEQSDGSIDDHDYFQRIRHNAFRGVLIDAGGVRGFEFLKSLNESGATNKVTPQCTPLYSPPEAIVEPNIYSPGMDVYAAALSIYTLVTGHVPYSHTQRQINPSDLVSVWEFKMAERREEISPINSEIIESVYFPDAIFRDGPKARDIFNRSLYEFLAHYCSPNPDERDSIHQMLDDFSKLFRFVSNVGTGPEIRIPGLQGIFSEESTLHRLMEAPGEEQAEGKKESVRLKRDPGLSTTVETTETIRKKLAGRRPVQDAHPRNYRPKTVRLRRRSPSGNLLSPPSAPLAPRENSPSAPNIPSAPTTPPITATRPGASASRQINRPSATPALDRFNRRKMRAELQRNAEKSGPTSKPRRPHSGSKNTASLRREPSLLRKRNPEPSAPKEPAPLPVPSEQLDQDALENQRAVVDSLSLRARKKTKNRIIEGGEALDQFIKEAGKGRDSYLARFPYPVLYLDQTEPEGALQDTAGGQILYDLQAPCVFPLKSPQGRPARLVSLGRSQEREVYINAPSISKLHAALALNSNREQWMIVDLGSTNESWVHSRKLDPLVPALLDNRVKVNLGAESFIFFTPEGFFEYLDSVEQDY
jgi:serine/threonine protein kinase